MDPTFVSIVIPVLNEEAYILGALRRLLDTSYPSDHMEIIVVDGGSTDRTAELASTVPGVRLLRNPLRLQSVGVNMAVRAANPASKWIIRCDCHSDYPPDFVATLVKVIGELDPTKFAAVFYSRVCKPDTTCFRTAAGWAYMSRLGGGTPHRTVGFSGPVEHSWHGAFQRAAFTAVGGYDETMATNEDVDLSYRLSDAGFGIWNDARLEVRYFARGNVSSLWRQFKGYGAGRAAFWNKRPGVVKRRHLPLIAIGPSTLLVLALASLSPWFLAALTPYVVLLLGVAATASVKERSACLLLLPIILATMHYSWGYGFLSVISRDTWRKIKPRGTLGRPSRQAHS
jgi:succinoglycan biosynthesis protein ExoA